MTCPVNMYVVRDPPEGKWMMLTGLRFRPSTKSPNWYRTLDLRLPGIPDQILHIEAVAAKHGLALEVRPMRRHRTTPPRTPPTVPSAAQWLKQHDKPSKLDRIRLVRKHSKALRARRRLAQT